VCWFHKYKFNQGVIEKEEGVNYYMFKKDSCKVKYTG
jgi:hypothetical protein